jgi:hypothetical protein
MQSLRKGRKPNLSVLKVILKFDLVLESKTANIKNTRYLLNYIDFANLKPTFGLFQIY